MSQFNNINAWEESKYTKWIKDYCVICKKHIKNDWENYFIRGNFCKECSARQTRNSYFRGRRMREKYGLTTKRKTYDKSNTPTPRNYRKSGNNGEQEVETQG